MRRNEPYIRPDGMIHRQNNNKRIQDFYLKRFITIIIVLSLMILSNPANKSFFSDIFKIQFPALHYNKNKHTSKWKQQSSHSVPPDTSKKEYIGSWNFLGLQLDFYRRGKSSRQSWLDSIFSSSAIDNYHERETNYILFSLYRRRAKYNSNSGVNLGIFFRKDIQLCQYNGLVPQLCQYLGENLCHGMKLFDEQNKAFTCLRIIQLLKIFFFILSTCYKYGNMLPLTTVQYFRVNPISPFLSVLRQPKRDFVQLLYSDMLSINLFFYPLLPFLEKVSSSSSHFYMSSLFIFFIVGGLSNLISSYVSHRSTFGMIGSIAASLGYLSKISSYYFFYGGGRNIIAFSGYTFSAIDILYGTLVSSVLFMFLPSLQTLLFMVPFFHRRWEFQDVITWIVGAFMGRLMCEYQLG